MYFNIIPQSRMFLDWLPCYNFP